LTLPSHNTVANATTAFVRNKSEKSVIESAKWVWWWYKESVVGCILKQVRFIDITIIIIISIVNYYYKKDE